MSIPSCFVNHPFRVSSFKENVEYVLLGNKDRGRMNIHCLHLNLCLCSHFVLRWATNITSLNSCTLPSPTKIREMKKEVTASPFSTLLNMSELIYQKGVDHSCPSHLISRVWHAQIVREDRYPAHVIVAQGSWALNQLHRRCCPTKPPVAHVLCVLFSRRPSGSQALDRNCIQPLTPSLRVLSEMN